MRLVFMGTSNFSVPILQAIYDSGHEIVVVYTRPPNFFHKDKIRKSPIHILANTLKIKVKTLEYFHHNDIKILQTYKADIIIVVSYGILLPNVILNIFSYGCLNIHASLLPRWRGVLPIQRCIEKGDLKSGITIIQMNKDLDTGPILFIKEVFLSDLTIGGKLNDKLSIIGSFLILEVLKKLENKDLEFIIQDNIKATYAFKISPRESWIVWNQSVQKIEQRLRALTPWPGNWCFYRNNPLKILKAHMIKLSLIKFSIKQPGQVISINPLIIACGNGFLIIDFLQKPGKKPMVAKDFINGFFIQVGIILN